MDKLENMFFRKAYDAQQRQLHKLWFEKQQNPALTSFEYDIHGMVRNIEFRKVQNEFQDKLKEDINEIRSSKSLFVFENKPTNLCELSETDYNRLLSNNITSNYRKCENNVKHKIVKETKKQLNRLILVKRWNVCLPSFLYHH